MQGIEVYTVLATHFLQHTVTIPDYEVVYYVGDWLQILSLQ